MLLLNMKNNDNNNFCILKFCPLLKDVLWLRYLRILCGNVFVCGLKINIQRYRGLFTLTFFHMLTSLKLNL